MHVKRHRKCMGVSKTAKNHMKTCKKTHATKKRAKDTGKHTVFVSGVKNHCKYNAKIAKVLKTHIKNIYFQSLLNISNQLFWQWFCATLENSKFANVSRKTPKKVPEKVDLRG